MPQYTSGHSTDGAVEFCKDRCKDPKKFYDFAGVGDPNANCSLCSGFFFQRHGNGHEICGFYVTDLNDATLDKVNHGHQDGSALCIKGKLTVQVHPSSLTDVDTAQENASVAVTNFVTSIGWDSCGANMVEWVNKTQRSEPGSQADADEDEQSVGYETEMVINFRYDISSAPEHFSNSTFIVRELLAHIRNSSLRHSRRHLVEDISSVERLGSCMNHICPTGTQNLEGPPAYCHASCCKHSECCTGGGDGCVRENENDSGSGSGPNENDPGSGSGPNENGADNTDDQQGSDFQDTLESSTYSAQNRMTNSIVFLAIGFLFATQ